MCVQILNSSETILLYRRQSKVSRVSDAAATSKLWVTASKCRYQTTTFVAVSRDKCRQPRDIPRIADVNSRRGVSCGRRLPENGGQRSDTVGTTDMCATVSRGNGGKSGGKENRGDTSLNRSLKQRGAVTRSNEEERYDTIRKTIHRRLHPLFRRGTLEYRN